MPSLPHGQNDILVDFYTLGLVVGNWWRKKMDKRNLHTYRTKSLHFIVTVRLANVRAFSC